MGRECGNTYIYDDETTLTCTCEYIHILYIYSTPCPAIHARIYDSAAVCRCRRRPFAAREESFVFFLFSPSIIFSRYMENKLRRGSFE